MKASEIQVGKVYRGESAKAPLRRVMDMWDMWTSDARRTVAVVSYETVERVPFAADISPRSFARWAVEEVKR